MSTVALPSSALAARETFLAAMKRDTTDPELSRLVVVLDDLLAWSEAHAAELTVRADDKAADLLRCERAGTTSVFWSARAMRASAPRLELLPQAARALAPEVRARALETLSAHQRESLVDGDRLRIGFGALKNVAARTAVLALMDELLLTGQIAPNVTR